ncbi:MAG: hypothetical protein ACC707_15675 [Thiohalomonadales bacterium]
MLRISFMLMLALFSLAFVPLSVASSNQDKIDWILKAETAPFGVVFEVVEGEGDALNWAIPQIKKFASQLRKRYPDMGIAVVSHGSEQFALTKDKEKKFEQVHKLVKSLSQDEDIPVHVCGTHASWRNKSAKDFPNYVTVSPAGPTEIRNYEDMGYELVVLDKP